MRNVHSKVRFVKGTSSPHCKALWEQATVEGSHKVVCAAQDTTIREYAELLITPLGAVALVVALEAPKSGFGAVSEFFSRQGLQYSLKTVRPFRRPSTRSSRLVVPPPPPAGAPGSY